MKKDDNKGFEGFWRGLTIRHICEKCGKEEILDCDDAYMAGWQYPPTSCPFTAISPRICPDCSAEDTVWAKLEAGVQTEDFDEKAKWTLAQILLEPYSLGVPDVTDDKLLEEAIVYSELYLEWQAALLDSAEDDGEDETPS